MAWWIYGSLLLASIVHPELDKLGLIVILIYAIKNYKISKSWIFILLSSIIICLYFYNGVFGNILYGIQIFIIGSIYSLSERISGNIKHLNNQITALYICHSLTVIFGVIQAVLWKYADVRILLDLTLPGKYDSIFTNPNPFGIVSGFSFMIAMNDNNIGRIAKYTLLILFSIGVYLSGSSSAVLITILTFIPLLLKLKIRTVIGIFLTIGACFIYFAPSYVETVLNKRVMIWQFGWRLMEDHMAFGLGFGKFQELASQSIGNFGAHSLYMDMFFSAGIVGLTLFLFGLASPLLKANSGLKGGMPYLSLLAVSLVESLLLFDEVTMLCLAISLSLIQSKSQTHNPKAVGEATVKTNR